LWSCLGAGPPSDQLQLQNNVKKLIRRAKWQH